VATLFTRPQADRGQAAIAPYIQGQFDEQRRQGHRERVSDPCRGDEAGSPQHRPGRGRLGAVHRCRVRMEEIMSTVPANVGVFFGQVDKRAEGWYWAGAQSEKLRGAIRGPFETKELAVEDALQSIREAPSDEPQERGAA
jgi:hypothetical protein